MTRFLLTRRQFAVTAASALALPGCASVGSSFVPAPPPGPDEALVYIYRRPNVISGFYGAGLHLNDVHVLNVANRSYSWFRVAPGAYAYDIKTVGSSQKAGQIIFEPGQTYYYVVEFNRRAVGAAYVFETFFFPKEADDALREMQDFRYAPATSTDRLAL